MSDSDAGIPWTLLRRSALPSDTLLLNDTRKWIYQLPEQIRPVLLPQDFPRIANELVVVWEDTPLALAKLDDLVNDKRGGRQGFPPLIHDELERLLNAVKQRPRPLASPGRQALKRLT